VRRFCRTYGVTYPIAMDDGGLVAEAIQRGSHLVGNEGIPATLFIDPSGVLACYRIGSMGKDELTYRIEKLLSASFGNSPPVASPSP
jgi:hypothetical protein